MADAKTSAFHTEINQLLSLTIDTFYSKKEVFLRELICNASNALDNMRFQGSTDKSKLDELELFIRLVPDKVNKTLSIIDTGIGMKKEDLENLGEIARFGTKVFLKALQACYETGADVRMDGHYGEGFYSAFLVAKKVIVTTKHTNDFQYIWEPQAGGSFTITEDVEGEQLGRGTKITLFLKEDQLEYLDEKRIKAVVKKYLKFISYPIDLCTEKTNEKEINDDEPEKEDERDIEELDDCTPSYRHEKNTQRASFKTMIGVQVLNDHYVVSNESKEGEEKKENDYEEILYKCEEDRFECDIVLEYFKETIEHIEEIVKKLNKTGSFSVEDLSARSLRSIKILYGDDVLYVINALKENAQKSLPVILKRLKQKYEEISTSRSDFNKLWAGVYSKYYHLSLQHDFSTKEEAEEGGDEQESLETNMSPKGEDEEGGEGDVNADNDLEAVEEVMEKKEIKRYDFDFPACVSSHIKLPPEVGKKIVNAKAYFHKFESHTVSNAYHTIELRKRSNRRSFYVSKPDGEDFLEYFGICLNDSVYFFRVASRGILKENHYAVRIAARGGVA